MENKSIRRSYSKFEINDQTNENIKDIWVNKKKQPFYLRECFWLNIFKILASVLILFFIYFLIEILPPYTNLKNHLPYEYKVFLYIICSFMAGLGIGSMKND